LEVDLFRAIINFIEEIRTASKETMEIVFYELVQENEYLDLPVEGFGCIVCVSSDGKLSLLSRMM